MNGRLRGGLVALLLLSVGLSMPGCGSSDFDKLSFGEATDAPGEVHLESNRIEIEQGIAVQVRISALDDGDDPLAVLDLESSNPDVFRCARGRDLGHYVLIGVAEGETLLQVKSRGFQKGTVPVEVLPPAVW